MGGFIRETYLGTECAETVILAVVINIYGVGFVSLLIFDENPSTIIRGVTFIIIDSVNR